ncbi:MAG: peptide chain release factor N(5)-glutamine methyltransferase [Proteobacteria bacterium]|nr:peptide chain release factor N(5)-glutamine methyltransferase [Pseudomonadota bacterium]
MDINEALRSAEAKLSAAGIETPRLDAEVLLAHAMGMRRTDLCARMRDELPSDARAGFDSMVERRASCCPVAYLTGSKGFWSREIAVTPDVLIPRPETETVVDEAVRISSGLKGPPSVLDLCTGSGCIAAALADELPGAAIVASDSSAAALAIAGENLRFAGERVRLLQGDLFAPIEEAGLGPFDIIAANPPYVPDGEMPSLPRDVRDYEPRAALAAGPGGLDFVARILEDAPRHLVPGGWLLMEIGAGQAEAIFFMATGLDRYDTVRTAKDLAGIDRVVIARKTLF